MDADPRDADKWTYGYKYNHAGVREVENKIESNN